MTDYKVIAIDLAKRNFHITAIDHDGKQVLKKKMNRDEFYKKEIYNFSPNSLFAFEACGGCNFTAQAIVDAGHKVAIIKAKDVKAYAKARQKNDFNDALAICKAACDPELKRVRPKTVKQQEISYLHKTRKHIIRQRIQLSNSLMSSLLEFGYDAKCSKSKFAKENNTHIDKALENRYITSEVYEVMLIDCNEIKNLIERERQIDKRITAHNTKSKSAQRLLDIPGIGQINASILNNKSVESYDCAKDFAASLGLVPKQNTTGGNISLGGITKQGDRYARTMLIQGGRAVVMRTYKPNPPKDQLYDFVKRLKAKGKCFNVICVAVANKLARIVYALLTKETAYSHQ